MSIININQIANPVISKLDPIKEKQQIFIPGIIDTNIPHRNGFIYLMTGSGGSGKSSLLLNMMTNKNMYKNKFNNIFYICPESSFLSAVDHPFKDHDKVFHELTFNLLEEIYQSLISIKTDAEEKRLKRKEKADRNKIKNKKTKQTFTEDYSETEPEPESETDDKIESIKYNCIIIDDYADALKDPDIARQLNKMLIKSRHICCAFIITLQSYIYFPKTLRKQITNATIFKTKNVEEFISIAGELFNMKKDDALILFNYCFSDGSYNHLDVDTWLNKYYKNFNELQIETKK